MGEIPRNTLERIQKFCLMDDDFMNLCFTDLPCVELVLRVVLDKPDLVAKSVKVQTLLKGADRSVWLDIYALDSENRAYDIELQRDDRGAHPRRARFLSSVLDSWSLKRGQKFTALRENFVIFITETDVLGHGLPVYHIDRRIHETGEAFGDGSHILYVNGAFRAADTPLGKLMHDFFCVNPDEMNYSLLAERTRFFKEDERGIRKMSRIMKEIRAEGKREGKREGRALGFIEGQLKTLLELVKKNLLSIADAAASAGMSESEFTAQMAAAGMSA